MFVNIPKSVEDPFYRYKRQMTKLSNQKLGLKFENLGEIAKSIYLPEEIIIKYIQKTLGCRIKGDLIYNKNITTEDIEVILEKLIEKILCEKCQNPEFLLIGDKTAKKNKKRCKACGHTEELSF